VRAAYPDQAGHVERDGVRLGYEVFGEGDPTILLLPAWTIVHSRFWKMQVPYLSRRNRVITYDGPGNGRSDRVTDPTRYSGDSYAADAAAVLDACGVERAVVVGLSLGAEFATRLAALYPSRVIGLVLIASALPLLPPPENESDIHDDMFGPYRDDPQGWDKYNVAYWHADFQDFVEYFFEQAFSEPHSTKPREDAVGWALEAGPAVLEASVRRPSFDVTGPMIFAGVSCPTLVIHGTGDRIDSHRVGKEAARLSGGTFVSMVGSGHIPVVRDPVRVNLLLRDFVDRLSA
jgi:pimeloyl-ACP methyl ester carboxylesterase